MEWEPVPLDTPLTWLATRIVVRGTDEAATERWVGLEISLDAGVAHVQHRPLFTVGARAAEATVPSTESTLAETVTDLTGITPLAAAVPPLAWPGERDADDWVRRVAGVVTSIVLALTVVAGAFALESVTGIGWFFDPVVVAVCAVMLAGTLAVKFLDLDLGRWPLGAAGWLLRRTRSLPPVAPGPVGHPDRLTEARERLPLPPVPDGPSPTERVDRIKVDYGALMGDVGYRIENSALFDAGVPQTQRFQVALLLWEDAVGSGEDPEAAASEVEESFALARVHAEQQGWAHLPAGARDPARTAAKAVRLALASDEPGEREAAARRAAGLLGSLALYYLPVIDPAVPSLLGSPKALER
ncbi:MAG: hypothetical protein Q4F65_10365 [Propionibacteriaceae bacterium]|nr:hypothetical protein [Propionibacteriaceae bacterium]